MERPDPIRPLLGAGTAFLIYWVVWNLLIPLARFVAGEMVADTVPLLIAAILASTLAMMIFESRGLNDQGFAWDGGSRFNLLIGAGLGIGGAVLMITPCLIFGLAHFEIDPGTETSALAMVFTPFLLLCGAAGEEILFRGFMLQYLMRGYGNWAGILGVGVLFGALHSSNPSASPLSLINTAGFGMLFGAALLRSKDLWLPIGMHFGWNATLPFLGVPLSGLTIKVTEYRLVWTSGTLWSGGNYGPEASLLASGVLVILAVVLWRVPVRKHSLYLLDSAAAP